MSLLPIANYLANVYSCLSEFALTDTFWANFESIYGTEYDFAKAEAIRSSWGNQDFSALPSIEVVSAEVLGSALGGYAASNKTIYLSDVFLATAASEQIVAVILEEIGHHVDAQVNSTDTPGDEGEYFAKVALVQPLTQSEVTRLQAENDWAVVTIDGVETAIEMATWTVSTYSELLGALSSADTNGVSDVINLGVNIRLTSALPQITASHSLTINGNGYSISGDVNNGVNDEGDVRLFYVNGGNVTFGNIVLTGSRAQGEDRQSPGGGGAAGMGGAVNIYAGTVNINDSQIQNNQAIGGDGGGSYRITYSIAGTADSSDYTGATPGTGQITFAAGSSTTTLT
ncbi:pectate lyase-like adhesive domain-containing protein, partial [Synechocystis salina]|nr:hypothetical protein [Synechocystis salina LEGE 00041]